MFSSNLSLDQAPPFSAPLRFFLTAPLFGILAGILVLIHSEAIFEYKSLATIGIVHLFTVGYFGLIMLGALQQMLPVLAGANLPKPVGLATVSHIFMSIGTLGLGFGLIYFNSILMLSSIALLIGFLTILFPVVFLLLKGNFQNPTINGMRIATIFGVLTVILGAHLGVSYSSYNFSASHQALADLHIAMGTLGWVLVLVISVAFQVIPMFYVTPKFSQVSMKWPLLIALMIIYWGLLKFELFTGRSFEILGVIFFAVAMTVFASEGFRKFMQRKRPLADTTIWYWRLSLVSLFVSGLFMIIQTVFELSNSEYLLGIFFGFGFAVSVLNGMLYKIIPFLAWFHLSASGRFDIPTMRDFLSDKEAKRQFFVHIASYVTLIGAYFLEELIVLAGLLVTISFLYLEINLIKSVKLYIKESKKEVVGGMQWS